MILNYLPILIPSVLLLFSSISVLFIKKYSTSYYLILIANILSLLSLILTWIFGYINYSLFSRSLYVDDTGYLFSIIVILGTIIALIGGKTHIEEWTTRSSMLSLISLSTLGLIYLSFAYNILIILGGWGISSAASYVIIMLRKDYNSVNAGIKYLIMGLISSSFMILGFAFYIVSTHTLYLDYSIIYYPYLFITGLAFITASFLFKIGAFPFQGWLPDVYTYADRESVAYVSSVGKLVGIIPLIRLFIFGDPSSVVNIFMIVLFSTISILSMTVGNIIAFSRKELSSILSFSSISQMGFILLGFVALDINTAVAEAGLITQSLAYIVAQAGLFNFVNHVEKVSGTSRFEGLNGLVKNDKGLAASSSILLLSLLGIPPIVGFWGKLFLFESVYQFPWLIIIAVINSAISAGYYIPVIREMFKEGTFNYVESNERGSVILSAVLSIAVGIISPLILVIV
ncbi:NADH-quinone oxidoreductase subunit NuoN [Acidianus sulfidivorans JP7]|uniref:NADH-quinone oxidoreductase subunit NuoN n=1 Tax=Acidianus sulfidivorans JP7 TaxID=619593 RepID=A0A2U9IQH5_9CREN|nr:NADH-quinone oxidoreductase subunit NuoN [Acidianus sulfidivorans]AWR98308.1 NADH-quinone oxidoreductase subunit NuoN [Acidianus sulfidivorans JP7]